MEKSFNEMGNFDKIKEEVYGWTLKPISKNEAIPMEIFELNFGYAVEQFQWESYYRALAMTQDMELKKLYGRIAFQEEGHLSKLGSLSAKDPKADPNMTLIESSLALQTTAIQGFSEAAQLEVNEILRGTFDYMLLDHLTHMGILLDWITVSGIGVPILDTLIGSLGIVTAAKTEAKPEEKIREFFKALIEFIHKHGRHLEKQFLPTDTIYKQPLNKDTVDVTSFVNAHIILANEVQLRNEYQIFRKMMPYINLPFRFTEILNLITAIENIHIAMLDSLMDPTTTPLEYLLINELMEIKVHCQGVQLAKSENARSVHEYALKEDEEHLSLLRDAYSNYGSPEKFKTTDKLFAQPQISASEYINQIAATS